MEFIVVLICLALQKLWPEGAAYHQNTWFAPYFAWVKAQAQKFSAWKGVLSIVVVVVPVLLVLLLLSTALRGPVGHLLLGVLVLWYCLGFDSLKTGSKSSVGELFAIGYQQVFAMIFWYALVGPWGVGLYYTLIQLRLILEKNEVEYKDILPLVIRAQGIMDWVPVRLLGISFALVGHFSVLFPLWLKELPGKIDHTQDYVMDWGLKSIELTKPNEQETTQTAAAQSLLDRSVILWLVALALISVGSWIS
ncbi:MAG TPA: regulatory signaling modulator protein AmpE [Coxiellaceae bacterium]|nr:regulatory signaling modulator protein AmpE [Coxiellaceae bacterium]